MHYIYNEVIPGEKAERHSAKEETQIKSKSITRLWTRGLRLEISMQNTD